MKFRPSFFRNSLSKLTATLSPITDGKPSPIKQKKPQASKFKSEEEVKEVVEEKPQLKKKPTSKTKK